jgi:hypothetical protein
MTAANPCRCSADLWLLSWAGVYAYSESRESYNAEMTLYRARVKTS